MSYYNTTQLSGTELSQRTKKAKSQEIDLLEIFKYKKQLTASEAYRIYNIDDKTPITSIRRAITNLCKKGDLFRTNNKKVGIYGRKEFVYSMMPEFLT